MTAIVVLIAMLGMLDASGLQPDRDRAVRVATDALSSWLKVAPDAIRLVSIEAVDWPNSSLGCPEPEMAYLPVIVPGFRVRLAVGERQHEVHTGAGRAIVCDAASSSRSRPIAPALAAADRARQHLAAELEVKAEELSVARVRRWGASDGACNPPEGTTIKGETFFVELKRGSTTYRYRATPELAWACK